MVPQDFDLFVAVQNLVTSFESPGISFYLYRAVDLHRVVISEAAPVN